MKKILSLLVLLLILGFTPLLASCSLDDLKKTAKNIASELELGDFDNKGHYKKDTVFHINGDISYDAETTYYSFDLKFKKDGSLVVTNLSTKEEQNYSYVVTSNLITVSKEDADDEYYYLYDDIIIVPLSMTIMGERLVLGYLPGNKDGVVVSERSKSVIGYIFEITVKKDDVPAVFTGKNTSLGRYIKVYKNGEIDKNTKGEYKYQYLKSDQITGFDSSEAGVKIVDVTVSNKTFKAPLFVNE